MMNSPENLNLMLGAKYFRKLPSANSYYVNLLGLCKNVCRIANKLSFTLGFSAMINISHNL